MNKAILVGLAILTVSTSAASATNRHHGRATSPNASTAVINPDARAPLAVTPGVSSKNHDMHMKSLRESGYDPKNDFTKSGKMKGGTYCYTPEALAAFFWTHRHGEN